jgi:hypothetical protein
MSRAADELGPASRLSGSSQLVAGLGSRCRDEPARRAARGCGALSGARSRPPALRPRPPRVFHNGRTGLLFPLPRWLLRTGQQKVDNQKITISENFQKSRSPKIQIVARNLEPIAPQQGAVFLVTIGDKAARLVLHLSPLPDAQPPRCTAAKRSTPLTVPLMKRRHPSG